MNSNRSSRLKSLNSTREVFADSKVSVTGGATHRGAVRDGARIASVGLARRLESQRYIRGREERRDPRWAATATGRDVNSRLFRHDLSVPPEVDWGAVVTSGLAGNFSGLTQGGANRLGKAFRRFLLLGGFHGFFSSNKGGVPELS